jgi:hypothetical protein
MMWFAVASSWLVAARSDGLTDPYLAGDDAEIAECDLAKQLFLVRGDDHAQVIDAGRQ